MVKVLCIAGTHSGVGKTSLSVGLMLALRQRGLVVQPFKVGPDFLDPMHHAAACGRPSINLDGWMLNKEQVLAAFHRHTADADVAVVEGVMGLFDSRDGSSEDGSTAQIAKWLGAPVMLVVDCWAMARSVAAMVKGYAEFDTELQLRGLLLNKVGSPGHGAWLSEALEAAWQQQRLKQQITVLGCIPKDEAVSVPERYLGLTMPHEQQQQSDTAATPAAAAADQEHATNADADAKQQQVPAYLSLLGQLISKHVDIDLLLGIAADITSATDGVTSSSHRQQVQHKKQDSSSEREVQDQQQHMQLPPLQQQQQQQWKLGHLSGTLLPRSIQPAARCRIAVARDEAFCFYYQDNLALLQHFGAELVFFSPLRSCHLPHNIYGIYLGGGYPEKHAVELSANNHLLHDVLQWSRNGGVMYAECGGLIYLCKGFMQPSARPLETPDQQNNSSNSSSSPNASTSTSSSSSSSRLVPLAGVLPLVARMSGMKMGYMEVQIMPGNPLFPAGTTARGQVYHFSEVLEPGGAAADAAANTSTANGSSSSSKGNQWNVLGSCGVSPHSGSMQQTYKVQQLLPGAQPKLEGYSQGNVLASYVHLHWGGCPELAAAFVDKCSSSAGSSANSGCNSSSSSSTGVSVGTACCSNAACGSTHSRGPTAVTSCVVVTVDSPAAHCCCLVAPTGSHSGSNNATSSSSSSFHTTECLSSNSSSRNDKIVSLLPSGTEIIYALGGLSDRLVGVSGFCDWPPAARLKPQAVRSLIDVEKMTSDEIEEAMQGFKSRCESPFAVDVELLATHKPGLVLTQDACGTCDADCSIVCKALQQAGLTPQTTQVLVMHPKTLAEVFDSILSTGAAAGVPDRAQQLVASLTARLSSVAEAIRTAYPAAAAVTVEESSVAREVLASCGSNTLKASGGLRDSRDTVSAGPTGSSLQDSSNASNAFKQQPPGEQEEQPVQQQGQGPTQWQQAPRVLSLEGLNPLVLGGQWLPDVKLAAGAVDASGQRPGDPPTRITWEQVVSFAPDVLLLCHCSRSPAAAMPDVQRITQLPGFRDLPAVQTNRVYITDHSYFSRPGPRLVDGVALLAGLLYGHHTTLHSQGADAGPGCQSQLQADHDADHHLGAVGAASVAAAPDTSASEQMRVPDLKSLTVDCSQGSGSSGQSNACSADNTQHHVLKMICDPDGQLSWVPVHVRHIV